MGAFFHGKNCVHASRSKDVRKTVGIVLALLGIVNLKLRFQQTLS